MTCMYFVRGLLLIPVVDGKMKSPRGRCFLGMYIDLCRNEVVAHTR